MSRLLGWGDGSHNEGAGPLMPSTEVRVGDPVPELINSQRARRWAKKCPAVLNRFACNIAEPIVHRTPIAQIRGSILRLRLHGLISTPRTNTQGSHSLFCIFPTSLQLSGSLASASPSSSADRLFADHISTPPFSICSLLALPAPLIPASPQHCFGLQRPRHRSATHSPCRLSTRGTLSPSPSLGAIL